MKDRIETALSAWGTWVATHPWRVILVVLLLTAGLGTQIRHFYLETSNDAFFHEDDPVVVQNDAFQETFGRDSGIAIALRPESGVFDPDFLAILRDTHIAIEDEVPNLVEVTSLWNVRETLGNEEGLEVRDFLEDWPETPEALATLEARARANALYQNFMLSEDGRSTMIVIETETYSQLGELDALDGFAEEDEAATKESRRAITGEEDAVILAAVEEILDRIPEGVEIHVAGLASFTTILQRTMAPDMARATLLSVGIAAAFLALLFRSFIGVALPLITVLLSVFATLSTMGAVGIPIMAPTQIIPSFLLAVGIGGAVHLVAIFYQGLRAGLDQSEAVAQALAHSGLPILMTSLTTAGGLLSFIPAALAPISHFGIISPIGVLLALLYVLVLLPAMLAAAPVRQIAPESEPSDTPSQRSLRSIGRFSTRRPGLVLSIWAAVLVVAGIGIPRIHIGHNMIEWFPETDALPRAIDFMNEQFGGGVSYEVLVSTQSENGLHDPEVLRRLEAVADHILSVEAAGLRAGKVVSIVDVVKETHRALNENRPEAYAIPDSRELVSQELLLFENSGSDDVEDLVTSDFETARLTVRVTFDDAALVLPYLEEVEPGIARILSPDLDYQLTGEFRIVGNTITAALATMLRSYSTALVIITLLMIVLIGRVRLGLLTMIPNLAPVVFTLGLMGWFKFPLDMISLMNASIIVGLAVDDTIHFMHNFRREFDDGNSVEDAVDHTLTSTGQALLFTSCVLACSFLVYTQAYLFHMFAFGVTVSAAIVVAFLADITLAPALVATFAARLSGRKG
ncbi:MAG: RND family transporter [Myxococcota bacterium]